MPVGHTVMQMAAAVELQQPTLLITHTWPAAQSLVVAHARFPEGHLLATHAIPPSTRAVHSHCAVVEQSVRKLASQAPAPGEHTEAEHCPPTQVWPLGQHWLPHGG
jgi:hypothetical protein